MKSNLLFTVVAVAGGSAMILGLSSARAARPGTPATPGAVTEGTLVRIDPKSDLAEPCPLKHTDVKAEISGFIARVSVTQEFVAQMIGVQRPALSVAMRQFKDAGLIRYARGQISIADRDGLLARSCGCINIIATEARRLETLERAQDAAS